MFAVWGEALCVLLRIRSSFTEAPLIGFFGVIIAFQVVYLPIVLTLGPLHVLKYSSLIVLMALTVVMAVIAIRAVLTGGLSLAKAGGFLKDKTLRPWVIGTAALFVFVLAFAMLRPYQGWDTSFYIGSMNEAIKTDTLYRFTGDTGLRESTLSPRYALSGFFMFFTVIASVCRIHPLLIAFYAIRPLGVILAALTVRQIGLTLFKREEKPALLFTSLFLVIQLTWVTIYKTSFFVERMYEAKGWCAYVLLPFTALLLFRLFLRKGRGRREWLLLAMTALAAIPVSMSSLVLYPALIFIGTAAMLPWCEERGAAIRRGILLMLPNILAAFVYILMSKGIFVIQI